MLPEPTDRVIHVLILTVLSMCCFGAPCLRIVTVLCATAGADSL